MYKKNACQMLKVGKKRKKKFVENSGERSVGQNDI